jgi:hypothetical protein
MQALTNRAKLVDRQADDGAGKNLPVEYSERNGYYVKAYFQKEATINYPEQKRSLALCSVAYIS